VVIKILETYSLVKPKQLIMNETILNIVQFLDVIYNDLHFLSTLAFRKLSQESSPRSVFFYNTFHSGSGHGLFFLCRSFTFSFLGPKLPHEIVA
jgi:4-diphosphocytidyl-2C-methyl-D-erythritol kinase